jgi:hypothetical protein
MAKKPGKASNKTAAKPKKKADAKAKAAPKKKKPAARTAKAAPKQTKATSKKAKPKAAKARPVARKPRVARARRESDAIPEPIVEQRLSMTARERMARSLPVLEILEDPHPIGALRRFLDSIRGEATSQQAQIALGSAQLMLLPARDHRGSDEVKELVDLILGHWNDFGERKRGFHAQEFLRNALAAVGVDRERIQVLEDKVPDHATSELLVNLACAHAVARDKVAMLRAVERALAAGAAPGELRRADDFSPYANDPDLAVLLARAEVPARPVNIEPYLPAVRAALDSLLSTLKELGESIELRPPVRLDAILDAERSGKISLPNDYRALLTLTNGMRLWEHEFFSAGDYREHTRLATRAQHYLESSFGVTGPVECVPVANWGQPNDWLLYDVTGRLRGGAAGYVLRVARSDEVIVEDLPAALAHMENLAREVLGTN